MAHSADHLFSEDHGESIWYIRVSYQDRNVGVPQYATGFSLDSEGLIMTCSHIMMEDESKYKIEVRGKNDTGFNHIAKVVCNKRKLDIMLLKSDSIQACRVANLARDGSLFVGKTIYHISCPFELGWTFLKGTVAYPINESDIRFIEDNKSCENHPSKALMETPKYRMMSQIWTLCTLDVDYSSMLVNSFLGGLHPFVPIVQIYGFIAGKGASGGPILNKNGEVVGMISSMVGGYECAVHVSVLRKVFSHYKSKPDNELKRESTDKGQVNKSKKLKGKAHHKRRRD